MPALRRRTMSTALLTLAIGWTITGCSTSESGDAAYVGTWNATSFTSGGMEHIAQGMTFTFTFSNSGQYAFTITNDQAGLCDLASDCSDSGTFTATDTQIVLDAGMPDATTLNYGISGNTMRIDALIDDITIVVFMDRS